MITRVLDDEGRVMHDCIAERCAVSWDGIVLDPDAYAEGLAIASGEPVSPAATVARGKPVPNAGTPDPGMWNVRGTTATLRRAATP